MEALQGEGVKRSLHRVSAVTLSGLVIQEQGHVLHNNLIRGMSVDVLSHFNDLDELVQVIYQGFERFVLLSKVEARSWTVHVGLMGTEGRWWRGSRSASDILQLVVSGPALRLVLLVLLQKKL